MAAVGPRARCRDTTGLNLAFLQEATMLAVGTVFVGSFTVLRPVAVGGMGAVYEVRDPND